MATCGGCRLLVLTVRTACGPARTVPLLRQTTCHPIVTSTRSYSLDSLSSGSWRSQAQPGNTERVSPPSGLAQRNLSGVAVSPRGQCRPHCRYDFLDLGEVEENTRKALGCRGLRRFIVEPALARLVTDHLVGDLDDGKAVIFECNPGPGVLTRTLLNCGAQRVVALESDKAFLPDLQALESGLDGQLEVVHCDFFKLDPMGHGSMKPPAMYSEKLFGDLAISEVPWTADVPVKVVGIFSQRNERNMLWKLVYAMFERMSIYRYGRVELNMFISEKEFTKLMAQPGHYKNYQALSALWQMACDIELLHKLPNDHLCLVRLTPREDFFNSVVTPSNSSTLVIMVKQCLAKRKARLIERLESWGPGSGTDILAQMGMFEDVLTGHVNPDEYKRLFELMEKSEEFRQSWLYNEILENTKKTGCI